MAKTKHAEQQPAHKTLVGQFKSAVSRATPLIAVTTADQCATVASIVEAVNGDRAFIAWDVMRGFQALNQNSLPVLAKITPDPEVTNLAEAVSMTMKGAPAKTVLFVYNAQRFIDEHREAQALCNLRDCFKANQCTLVLLAPQIKLPQELATDVVVLDEPLPDQKQLEQIVRSTCEEAGAEVHAETVYRAVEAVQGLPAFAAEQVVAMSVRRDEDRKIVLDLDGLWDRKRKQIEQTPGLSVNREGTKFSDLGGLEVAKDYFKAIINSPNGRPNAVVFIDEIEKMLAGASGDTSGVSQDQLGTLLSFMQDHRAAGVLLVGHPGSGKSALAKATGNEAGIPTISLDLGGAKGSLVGESEKNLRQALKVIDSVSNGSTLWIATSNGIQNLPPELRRRFKFGVFMFDLPDENERKAIWKVHRERFGIEKKDQNPDDTGWTGAEIEQCCELAWRLNKSLAYASNFVVPISQSAPERIESLRSQADGRWLSASHPGVYRKEQEAKPLAVAAKRKFTVE